MSVPFPEKCYKDLVHHWNLAPHEADKMQNVMDCTTAAAISMLHVLVSTRYMLLMEG